MPIIHNPHSNRLSRINTACYLRRYGGTERGAGNGVVLGVMIGVAVIWAMVYGISNWIYNTTHERDKKNKEMLVENKGKHKKPVPTPTYAVKDAGSYAAECTGVFNPSCKPVQSRSEDE